MLERTDGITNEVVETITFVLAHRTVYEITNHANLRTDTSCWTVAWSFGQSHYCPKLQMLMEQSMKFIWSQSSTDSGCQKFLHNLKPQPTDLTIPWPFDTARCSFHAMHSKTFNQSNPLSPLQNRHGPVPAQGSGSSLPSSGVPRNFFGGRWVLARNFFGWFPKLSWGERAEGTGIWGR
jgi:hypothetical protein